MSLDRPYRAIVFGATGGIGAAFIAHLQADAQCEDVVGLSRSTSPAINFSDEGTIAAAADALKDKGPFHLMIDATGILSDGNMQPEKALKNITMDTLQQNFLVNAWGPALLLKHFHPLLPREGKSVFATLSAKVGSIGDNQIGGWYSYRASKAALNMIVKTASIEIARKWTQAVVIALHPGTVDTGLSRPFSGAVTHEIFSASQASQKLLDVIDSVTPAHTGGFFNYDGKQLPW